MATTTTTTTTSTSTTSGTSQVRIHLQTRSSDEDIQLPETGPILVSTDFRRFQLSTLVNRLLDTAQPIPLEFLIDGHFLRGSLDDFLTRSGLSAETTLQVEYVKALLPPRPVASYEHDDWVSAVDVLSPSADAAVWAAAATARPRRGDVVPSRILSASYDGTLTVWGMSSDVRATGRAHTAAVKAARFLSPTQIVSAGLDRTVRLWKYDDDASDVAAGDPSVLMPTLELHGHGASVDGLDVHAPSARILSASADHSVGFWSTRKSDAPAAPAPAPVTTSKRRKLSSSSSSVPAAPRRGPLGLLHGHHAPVSSSIFDATDATVAYSASWDHSVKTWDLATATCVDTRTPSSSSVSAAPLLALVHLRDQRLLAAASTARSVALLDPRANATATTSLTLRGHSNAVAALAPDPASSHRILSASHDGSCRLWDLRAAGAAARDGPDRVAACVHVVERPDLPGTAAGGGGAKKKKLFAVRWDTDVGIVSGGEDCRVVIHRGGEEGS